MTTPDAPAAMSAAVFLRRLVTVECIAAFGCQSQYPENAHESFAHEWGTDLDDCVVTDYDLKQLPQIEAAIAGGRITWDPTLAATCLAAPGIPSSCPLLFADHYDWAESCYAALIGNVADGAACTTDWECALGSMCKSAVCKRD